jgi:predicted  nucleic acid-binding Zn-ribbon protein
MKKLKTVIATSLLVAAPLALPAQSTNQTTIQDVKQAGKNAVTTAGNYTEQQIKDFNKAAEKQFRDLGKKLDDLRDQAQKQTGQARADLDKKITEAQKKLDDLKPKLKELKTAATNAWSDAKSAFQQGIEEIKQKLP